MASEVFLIARRRRDSIPDPPLPWLLGVARNLLETALAVFVSLPDRDVETLTLVTWHGLNIADAATVVGCSPRAFTVRLHRARRRLTDALRDAGETTVRPPVTSLQGK